MFQWVTIEDMDLDNIIIFGNNIAVDLNNTK